MSTPTVTFPEMFNLADYFLFDRLEEPGGPERTALLFGDHSWTYADVAERARGVADILQRGGIDAGDRVYIVLPDIPPFAWAYFGTLSAGAVVTLGNPRLTTEELAYVLDYVDARALITVPDVAERLADLIDGPDAPLVLLAPDAATGEDPEVPLNDERCLATQISHAASPRPRLTHRDAPAVWLFTSGSTGRPKAAMHCHRDFAFNTEVYAKGTIGYDRDDICVSVPRLFFGYATGTNLMFPFAVGACVGLFSEWPTPERIAWAVRHYRATGLTNVPTMMSKLLEADAAGTLDVDLGSLRWTLSAGEALPPALLDRWMQRYDAPVYDGIGSAEMFHIYLTNRPDDVKPGSLGRPVDGYTLRILPPDAEGPGAAEVPLGDTGTLWVKGDSVAYGYWKDRDKSWGTFHGHWCRSGDLFRRDDDGYYWFGGRADNLLKVSGQFVSPLEVEHTLCAHPEVVEAAVIGVEHEGLTSLRAFVQIREGGTEDGEGLATWLRRRLSKIKVPRDWRIVEALPRNDRGKIDKKALPRD